MARLKDVDWNLREGTLQPDGARTYAIETIQAALLMDIRDELRAIRAVLQCSNTQRIPAYLRDIRRHLGASPRQRRTK